VLTVIRSAAVRRPLRQEEGIFMDRSRSLQICPVLLVFTVIRSPTVRRPLRQEEGIFMDRSRLLVLVFTLTSCTPTKYNFYFADSLAIVVSEHTL
jgi:hypothetical protein